MPVVDEFPPFASWTFLRKLLVALCLGTFLMMLHHIGVLAAWWNPPAGYSSLGYVNNLDVPQYLTWIQQAQNRILVPNLHAPWLTEPALFQPLMVMTSRLPFPVIYSYYGLHLLMYWLASFCLIEAGFTFCRSWRQLAMASVVVVCELPLKMLLDDEQICAGLALMQLEAKLAVEPAAGAVAAALFGPYRKRLHGKHVGLIVCGANIDGATYARHLDRGLKAMPDLLGA